MRRDTLRLDLEGREASMGDRDLELGRLDDDRGVRSDALEYRRSADGRELLVGNGSHDHVALQPRRLSGREEDRRDRTLHVIGAATVQPAVLDARRMRTVHPGNSDGVEVPVQEQGAPTARATTDRDHARALDSDHLDLEPSPRTPLGDKRRGVRLSPGTGDQTRIDRVDRDQPSSKLGKLRVSHAPSLGRIR